MLICESLFSGARTGLILFSDHAGVVEGILINPDAKVSQAEEALIKKTIGIVETPPESTRPSWADVFALDIRGICIHCFNYVDVHTTGGTTLTNKEEEMTNEWSLYKDQFFGKLIRYFKWLDPYLAQRGNCLKNYLNSVDVPSGRGMPSPRECGQALQTALAMSSPAGPCQPTPINFEAARVLGEVSLPASDHGKEPNSTGTGRSQGGNSRSTSSHGKESAGSAPRPKAGGRARSPRTKIAH